VGTLRYSIWIDAPALAVWTLWTDLARIPEWQTGSPKVVEATGPGDAAGTRYTVRRGPTSSRTTVVHTDAPRRYESRTQALLGLTFSMAADLVAEGRGTRLSLEARTHWPRGLGMLGRAVEAAVLSPQEATRELAAFKALVEGQVATDA
jgi:uncharacterized protein YndB with AHSA1/START domain